MTHWLPTGLRTTLLPLTAALTMAWLPASAEVPASSHPAAERALMQGRIDEAVNLLRPIVSANNSDGAAHLLLCRAFYAEDHIDEAVTECEAAVRNGLGSDSQAQDWMGRVYGRKADISGPFTGLKLAHRVRDSFEASVNFNPTNADAVDDLADYYLQAPSMVGGGLDRARALAARVNAQLPERALRLRALIAEKQKDFTSAERDLRSIAEKHNDRPDGWNDLATFYVRQKNTDKAVEAVRQAISSNRKHNPSLVQSASILIGIHREPKLAEDALRAYLTGGNMEDGAPAVKAHTMLGNLLAAGGNKVGARAEYTSALALAANYAPARKALQAQ